LGWKGRAKKQRRGPEGQRKPLVRDQPGRKKIREKVKGSEKKRRRGVIRKRVATKRKQKRGVTTGHRSKEFEKRVKIQKVVDPKERS